MGRFVKNVAFASGSYAVRLPVISSNLLGPEMPVTGQVRFNTNITNGFQFYNNNTWHDVSAVGRVNITKDTFIGDGATTSFGPMTNSYTSGEELAIIVFVGNVYQEAGVAYTVSSNTISFTEAPALGIKVVILHNFNSTSVI